MGLTGPSAPLLVQNGWTDDLFPAPEALRVYRTFHAAPGARISLQLADLGHPRGANDPAVDRALLEQGAAVLRRVPEGARGSRPRHGSVLAYTQTCPGIAPGGGRFKAENWERLHPKTVTMRRRGAAAHELERRQPGHGQGASTQIGSSGSCATVPAEHAKGTAIVERRFSKPFTLLGMPLVQAQIRTKGRGGFIAARLWDVHDGTQVLVSRGVYRLRDDQSGSAMFQLFGNGWRFARGHTAKLELLGNDPNFLRTSNFKFRVTFSRTRVDLPGR